MKDRSDHCNVLGVRVDAITMDEAILNIQSYLHANPSQQGRAAFTVYKPYVEFMTRAHTDNAIRSILNKSDMCLPDGSSLQWAASFLYGKPSTRPSYWKLAKSLILWLQKSTWRNQILPEKFAGVNFTSRLFDAAEYNNWRVGVIGGSASVDSTKQALVQRWPKLNLVGVWSGFTKTTTSMNFNSSHLDPDYESTLDQIKAADLDILFVAMGFPRQEMFIDHNRANLNVRVMIGEGGSFDYAEMGGKYKRAPRWVQNVHLEWLWRLVLQPSRIKRQLAIPHYIWLVKQQAKTNWNREKVTK